MARHLSLFAVLAGSSLCAHTIVLRDDAGHFQFIEAESVFINGKTRLRSATGVAESAALDSKQLDRLPPLSFDAAGIVRKSATGGWLARTDGGRDWLPLAPETSSVKFPQPLTATWNQAAIAYRRDKAQKTLTPISNASLAFIVTNRSVPEAAALLSTHFWPHIAEEDKSGADGMRAILPSAAAAAVNSPSLPAIRNSLVARLRSASNAWARGNVPESVLTAGLEYVEAAGKAFPADAELKSLTEIVRRQKARLDRDVVILQTLDSGKYSAHFLRKYRDFERFDRSFETLAEARRRHYKNQSATLVERGLSRYKGAQFPEALRDLRAALRINPSDLTIAKAMDEVRLESARRSALAVAEKRKGIDTRAPREVQLRRHLLLADQLFKDAKLDDAIQSIESAAAIDPTHPGVALAQARILESKGELGAALRAIDAYNAMIVSEADVLEGEKIRAGIDYKIQQRKQSLRSELETAFRDQKFAQALDIASRGLKLDPEDSGFLFQAGANACILRKCAAGAPLLQRYIEYSDSLNADRATRLTALALLNESTRPPQPPAPAKTPRSWFSGSPVAEAAYYDPASLVFLPKVGEIKASKKLSIAYEWSGERLAAVRSKYEDNKVFANIFSAAMAGVAASQGLTTSMTTYAADRDATDFFFRYYEDVPQIQQVSRKQVSIRGGKSESLITPPVFSDGLVVAQGNVESYTRQADETQDASKGFITLRESPRVDTELAYLATGRRVTTAFSGNPYFHPFAWQGIHLFEASYDNQGRIAYAWEKGATGGRLDFTWEGQLLTKVEMRQPNGDGPVTYSRTLSYSGSRLLSESIQHGGRTSKILYKYDKQGKLVEAECDEDHSLDGRSRRAVFMGQ